ncbi:hypothetical protein [Desulfolutivibrio sulfodismutans]|uniref:hypothetical protein n=1 Tax=Desulfolutivibrio sulfodismutans TaxID=63561 RepID=UPI00159D9BF3|nr:hypothetical protein [Desulfolutivibrio sulfodismutans]
MPVPPPPPPYGPHGPYGPYGPYGPGGWGPRPWPVLPPGAAYVWALPAAAVALSVAGAIIYQAGSSCYQPMQMGDSVVYQPIPCP